MQVMQAVLLLPALLAISFASKHLDEEWEMWTSKYGKKYLTADVEKFRRNAWEATWQKVRDHNLLADRGNKSYRLEMNHFADLLEEHTAEEIDAAVLKVHWQSSQI